METVERNNRKVAKGTVISNKMDKTVVVRIDTVRQHPRYGKVIKHSKKVYAHSDLNKDIGEVVTVMETRPLSKTKRWRVVEENTN